MSKQRGRPRDVAKEQFWREMIGRHQQGRLSVREFCDEHSLDEGAFFYLAPQTCGAGRYGEPSIGSLRDSHKGFDGADLRSSIPRWCGLR